MSYQNHNLIKSFKASAAIDPFTIVKFASAAGTVEPASSGGSNVLLGVTNELGIKSDDVSKGALVDVVLGGIAQVKLGGTVSEGDELTTSSSGKALKAQPSQGNITRVIGVAFKAGVAGDVIPMLIDRTVKKG